MPFAFHCQEKPPPDLPPIPIPGMDNIMSNDGVARVFNLDPRLQESKSRKYHKMTPREGGFLNSIRASFSGKNIRSDDKSDSRTTPNKNDKRRREKRKERERDLSFVILPRSTSSLTPGKPSNATFSVTPPPLPRRDDRLPRHSNLFTGVPTPTDSVVTSTRNSQHTPSKPGTPVHEHTLRSSRSVPDWTTEQRKQYCYFQSGSEDQLPRIPSAYKPQPILNPGMMMVDKIEKPGGAAKAAETLHDSLKLTSIGRYRGKQKTAEPRGDETFHLQRSSVKPQISQHLGGGYGVQERESPISFLEMDRPRNGMNGRKSVFLPVCEQPQRPEKSPILQSPLPQTQQWIRCRSTALAGATEGDQKHIPSTSQHPTGQPTSTSIYHTHHNYSLCPVAEEIPPSIPLPKWGGIWSPHLQQDSELFFETEVGVNLSKPPKSAPGTPPLVEMGIPSPQAKKRPASWACPTRTTAVAIPGLMRSSITCHSREIDAIFPPTPPSSTGDVWDDHNDSGVTTGERNLFWNSLRHSWNIFILVWALLLLFKSVQFVVNFIEVVVLEPVKLFRSVLRNVVEG